MSVNKFERFAPWCGAIAGLAWIGQSGMQRLYSGDLPGQASVEVTQRHPTLNAGSTACVVVMGVALLFFATAVRNLLRSGEAREATYSSVAYAAWITVSAALGQMALWNKALLSAADDQASAAMRTLGYAQYFGWLAMGIGVSTAFLAFGLGGIRHAVLPKWFAITTIVLGALALLGAAGIPPGGAVNYVLLPFWLIAAAFIVAKRQKTSPQPAVDRTLPTPATQPQV